MHLCSNSIGEFSRSVSKSLRVPYTNFETPLRAAINAVLGAALQYVCRCRMASFVMSRKLSAKDVTVAEREEIHQHAHDNFKTQSGILFSYKEVNERKNLGRFCRCLSKFQVPACLSRRRWTLPSR